MSFTVTRSASVSRRETQETEKKSLREEFLQKITDAVKPLIEQVAALGARLEALTTELKGAIFSAKQETKTLREQVQVLQQALETQQQVTYTVESLLLQQTRALAELQTAYIRHTHPYHCTAPYEFVKTLPYDSYSVQTGTPKV